MKKFLFIITFFIQISMLGMSYAATTATTPTTTSTSTTSTTASTTSTASRFTVQTGGCILDTKTNLMWEVKTRDKSLHDKNWTYSWYEPDTTKNGGYAGTQNRGYCKMSRCDTYSYVNAVNINGWCGSTKWRLPTNDELKDLVYCSNGYSTISGTADLSVNACVVKQLTTKYSSVDSNSNIYHALIAQLQDECYRFNPKKGGYYCKTPSNHMIPTIDAIFSDTLKDWYWSSSVPTNMGNMYAWAMTFDHAFDYPYGRANSAHIRLVSAP